MYGVTPAQQQVNMMRMNQMNTMMGGGLGMGMGLGLGMGMGTGGNPNMFVFVGNSISLQGRLDSITDQQLTGIQQATINVSGTQIQAMSIMGIMCTALWGGFLIIPLFFMCMNWWKKCVYPAYSIPASAFMKMDRIFKAPNINNITLTLTDNTFNGEKAMILYNLLLQSRIRGFTFINAAGMYNFNDS